MLRNEIAQLKPVTMQEVGVNIGLCAVLSALGYYLDHARIFAFGIVPVMTITRLAYDTGVSIKTPILLTLKWVLMIAFMAGSFWWVVNHPRH